MWNKIAKRVGIYLAVAFLLVSAVDGYVWYANRDVRADARRYLDEASAQSKALEALGEKSIELVGLTREGLQKPLGPSLMRLPAGKNSSRLGWACGQWDCLVWATFAVPTNQNIPPNTAAAALMIDDRYGYLFGSTKRVSIDGVYLGEPVAQLKEQAKRRGYGKETGHNRITWDKDWSLIVSSVPNDKASLLVFLNQPILAGVGSKEKASR